MNQRKLDIMRVKAQARARRLYEEHLANMQGERGSYASTDILATGREGTERTTTDTGAEETTEDIVTQAAET